MYKPQCGQLRQDHSGVRTAGREFNSSASLVMLKPGGLHEFEVDRKPEVAIEGESGQGGLAGGVHEPKPAERGSLCRPGVLKAQYVTAPRQTRIAKPKIGTR